MTKVALGLGGYVTERSSGQRSTALSDMTTTLSKGDNDVVAREVLYWSTVQPSEGGPFDWTVPDGMVTACANAGVRVWFILSHPPVWATAPGGSAGQSWPCPPYADVQTAGSNSALQAYAAFCGAAAARYAEGGTFWSSYVGTPLPVKHFEVWNEEYTALASSRWNGSTAVSGYSDPAAYAAIYNAAAAAIHAVPHAKAAASLTDKTWNSDPVGAPYLDIFLENVTERVDVASLHPYPYNYQPASYTPATADRWQYFTLVQDVRAKLDAANYTETTIWITEIGWPTHSGGVSEATQASRFADLWTVVGNLGYIEGLIIFCVTHSDYPDNPALPNYSVSNPECFFALWHTGATTLDIGSAKPAVATITGLSSITYTAAPVYNFIKPGLSGELPATVGVSYDSLPEKSRGTALKYLMQPLSDIVYPASDVTSYVVNGTTPSYSGMKVYTYSSSPARLRFSGNLTNFSGYGANRINGADISSSYSWTGWYLECYVNGTDVAFQCFANADGDFKVFVDDMPLVYGWEKFSSGGGDTFIKIQFATSRTRKVRLHIGLAIFGQVLIPGTGDVWPASPRFRVAITGDSYVHGAYGTSEGTIGAGTIAGELAIRTGWEVWNLGQGGTGYQNPGNGTTSSPGPNGADYYGSASRLSALAALPAMDMVIVWGGANDGNIATYPIKKTVNRANSLWSAIKTALPNTPLVVAGIESGVYPSLATDLNNINSGLKAAALAHPGVVAFIDMRSPQMWVDGTGRIDAQTGDGNADIFVSSDTLHPTHAGWGYVATRLVQELANVRI